MFENWAADVLANYLGKFVDVQRDRLRISLWGGKCMQADMKPDLGVPEITGIVHSWPPVS